MIGNGGREVGRVGYQGRDDARSKELPDKGAQFPGDSDDDRVVAQLACRETVESVVESILRSPTEILDLARLGFLAFAQDGTDFGIVPVVLSTLSRLRRALPLGCASSIRFCGEAVSKHPPDMAVAALGNASLPPALVAGFLAGNQAKVAHQLPWMFEPVEITDLGDDGHDGHGIEAAESFESIDLNLAFPFLEDLLELGTQGGYTGETLIDGFKAIFEHEVEGGIGEARFAQIAQVSLAPIGLAGVGDPVAHQEGSEALLVFAQILAGIGASATEIAHRLIHGVRNVDALERLTAQLPCNLEGIALVGFDPLSGSAFHLGGVMTMAS